MKKLYTEEVTHCLNCPNFIQYKQGAYLSRTDPMACGAMNYKEITWRMIPIKDKGGQFPKWCPLQEEK